MTAHSIAILPDNSAFIVWIDAGGIIVDGPYHASGAKYLSRTNGNCRIDKYHKDQMLLEIPTACRWSMYEAH